MQVRILYHAASSICYYKTMLQIIDTHAHLDEVENLDQVLGEAKEAGLTAIIAVGGDVASNARTLEIVANHPGFVYPALGYHPENIKEAEIEVNLEFIKSHTHEAVAIGEVGLDYSKWVRATAEKDLQKRVLKGLLKIAKDNDKPALVHSRYAWRDALDAVIEAGLEKAVFHWYTGTSSVLRDIVAHGYYISVTPAVEYHEEHRRAVKEAPLDRLLLETDCPVVYARGKENEFKSSPADVVRSLRGAAVLRGMSEEEMAKVTTENARRLFGIV
jgi:TatD DNase family protein